METNYNGIEHDWRAKKRTCNKSLRWVSWNIHFDCLCFLFDLRHNSNFILFICLVSIRKTELLIRNVVCRSYDIQMPQLKEKSFSISLNLSTQQVDILLEYLWSDCTTHRSSKSKFDLHKRPTDFNAHLSTRDSTHTSCLKGSYLHNNSKLNSTLALKRSIIIT